MKIEGSPNGRNGLYQLWVSGLSQKEGMNLLLKRLKFSCLQGILNSTSLLLIMWTGQNSASLVSFLSPLKENERHFSKMHTSLKMAAFLEHYKCLQTSLKEQLPLSCSKDILRFVLWTAELSNFAFAERISFSQNIYLLPVCSESSAWLMCKRMLCQG